MTILEFVHQATKKLTVSNVPTARLDSLILLEDALGKDRSWLLAHPTHLVSAAKLESLVAQIERRANHEPLAYIRGRGEFYGREFLVTADTLQPRPETETMIELLLEQAKSRKLKVESIVDVGTGSGCIAITAKLEKPNLNVVATDISEACLKVAKMNAKKLGADIQFYRGDLLVPLPITSHQSPITILANLPYVPDSHTINQAAMHEPKLAIFGGDDGLDYYRQLFDQIKEQKISVDLLLSEALPPQHEKLESLANAYGFLSIKSQDFIQVFKSTSSA
tara:strand:- start:5395 stop:6231 length:837 start_codon:yes stop_codon:yes gene_type:complete